MCSVNISKALCRLAKPKVAGLLRKKRNKNRQYTYWQISLTESKYHSPTNDKDQHHRLCLLMSATGHCSLFDSSTVQSTNNNG